MALGFCRVPLRPQRGAQEAGGIADLPVAVGKLGVVAEGLPQNGLGGERVALCQAGLAQVVQRAAEPLRVEAREDLVRCLLLGMRRKDC